MRILAIIALAATLVLAPLAARADYFVWRDVNTGLSLSFPDTWKIVNNTEGADLLTVEAPSDDAHAACYVRAMGDRQFLVYPPQYSAAIQKINFSTNFWNQYLSQYTNTFIHEVRDGAGLGRGYAGYALADYYSAVPGPGMVRRAMAFASLYNDKVYVLECSSRAEDFNDWKDPFLSIAGSIDFEKVYNELTTGNYRDFLQDRRIQFRDIQGRETVSY